MKLLILTQKVDINDDLLGFMHGWIKEFAKRCEKVTVICLQKGECELPGNVKVLSLGKEKCNCKKLLNCYTAKLLYCCRFYKYIWQERKNYEKVFVHMNKEYVILGGLFWRISGKKVGMWYNHLKGGLFSKLAGIFANNIFYTSPFSFFANYKKAIKMPAGINTNIFKRDEKIKKIKNSILYLGRISLVKNVHVLIKAVNKLDKKGVDFILNIVGEPGDKDKKYFKKIKDISADLESKGKIKFLGKVPNYQATEIYNRNEFFINLTDSGSLDKTTLEAMSCESMVIVCNKSFEKIFFHEWHNLLIFKENNEKDLAEKILKLINLDEAKKEKIKKECRKIIMENHGLKAMADKIIKELC